MILRLLSTVDSGECGNFAYFFKYLVYINYFGDD
jgi:hypothetical protein